MSLGRTGTMWLIQQKPSPLSYTYANTLPARVNTRRLHRPLVYTPVCTFDDSAETKNKRLPSNIYGRSYPSAAFIFCSVTLLIVATISHFSEVLH